MPPDADLRQRSRAALELWRSLRDAYDAIGAALAAPEEHDLGQLAERIVRHEHELRPLLAELSAARARGPADHEIAALWRETDEVVAALASCHPDLIRAALAARHATAERLAALRLGRQGMRGYAGGGDRAAALTSRHA
jgi:hypothetical protein